MVGNDVVDLTDAETREGARHPRFDARVFAPGERRKLAAAGPETPLRWALWAAKEAAYKVARRRDPACTFSPALFVVELDARLAGRVRHGGAVYPVRVTLNRDWVHAVATAPRRALAGIAAGVHPLGDAAAGATPGLAARRFAIAELAPQLGDDPASLSIHSRERIPRLRRRSGPAADLSLSHHGRFVAYACALPQPHTGLQP
jgi:phosphopantetheinyl transferase (holo-ACP synthase)